MGSWEDTTKYGPGASGGRAEVPLRSELGAALAPWVPGPPPWCGARRWCSEPTWFGVCRLSRCVELGAALDGARGSPEPAAQRFLVAADQNTGVAV